MATLFAPQVRAVQPAFPHDQANFNFYFSLSNYNTRSEINTVTLVVKDPTKTSLYGQDTIFTSTVNMSSAQVEGTEYRVTFSNSSAYWDLTTNGEQYYQAQIYFTNSKGETSDYSQITLLRPIWGINKNASSIVVNAEARQVAVSISHKGTSAETIDSYYIDIITGGKTVYTSNVLNAGTSGFTVSTIVNYYFQEGKTYTINAHITTKNGYKDTLTNSNVYVDPVTGNPVPDTQFILSNDEDGGAVQIEIASAWALMSPIIKIQRTTDESEFLAWCTVAELKLPNKYLNAYNILWRDYAIEGGKFYQYRFIITTTSNSSTKYLSNGHYFAPQFGDMFLSSNDRQLAIRYNSNLSGFKWVTQENITNTLGGRFPIIRRNAETKYRQFNISGSLYFDAMPINGTATDSTGKSISRWITEEDTSLFFSLEDAYNFQQKELPTLRAYIQDQKFFEKRFRDAAMSFLTDGNIKLFRSFQEGNMIVYLSNISFTPNKQLDRRIYDFSATVTEVCEATPENMKKYGLEKPILEYRYILTVYNNPAQVETIFTPQIGIDQMFDSNSLIVQYEEVFGDVQS